jgi:3-deoxy-manno-octulosonate cytidylyltransferase (CMP-KDO synthetase)
VDVEFSIVIPARFASLRLPGKPLREICGKPMIEWVYQAGLAAAARDVVVATDDRRIADAVTGFGGQACLTDSQHNSGTDRILEVVRQLEWDGDTIVVNLQGDEPLMPAANLAQVASNLALHDCSMATLCKPVTAEAAADSNLVKVVRDSDDMALYYSRAAIPFARSGEARHFGHIGIYAYRVDFLETFSSLDPHELELTESLEQLRALGNGYSIHCAEALESPGPGVDTEADLRKVETLIAECDR